MRFNSYSAFIADLSNLVGAFRSSSVSNRHEKDQPGSLAGITKSLRVLNPLRRSSCASNEGQAQQQSFASSSARPKLLIPDDETTMRHLRYVESPPSTSNHDNIMVSSSMSSHDPSRVETQSVECPSPSTPHLKHSGSRPSNELLAEIGLRKYHTDSSSDEEISPIHHHSQVCQLRDLFLIGTYFCVSAWVVWILMQFSWYFLDWFYRENWSQRCTGLRVCAQQGPANNHLSTCLRAHQTWAVGVWWAMQRAKVMSGPSSVWAKT